MKGGHEHWMAWGQYVAVAAAYEAVYEITRYFSPPQFLLTTGLRLACMILLPRRFWTALAVGELVPLAQNAVFCADKFGLAWAIVISIPSVVLYWPALDRMLKRWPMYSSDGRLQMHVIVYATMVASVITAGLVTATWLAAVMHNPAKFPVHDPGLVLISRFTGSYLGALTLTPVILALRERYRDRTESLTLDMIWRSQLLRDMAWWVMPTLGALAWGATFTQDEGMQQILRIALIWPVLGMAWRHGWHGTAIGGMMASYALAATAHGLLDTDTLKVQLVLSVVLSGALIMGARSQVATSFLQPDR